MKAERENDDPSFWRQRADDARRLAEQVGDDVVAQNALREIAASYEQLAKLAEERRIPKG
jgi:hypothetical protein